MRLGIAVVVGLCIGCGGTTTPTPAADPHPVRREPWSVGRVLATLPPDTGMVLRIDLGRVQRSKLVAPYWKQALDRLAGAGTPTACAEAETTDATIVAVIDGTAPGGSWTVWALGADAPRVRRCLDQLAAVRAGTAAVATGGDYATISTSTSRVGVLFLDERTVLFHTLSTPTVDRAATIAATRERDDAPSWGDDLADLVASSAAAWLYVAGTSPLYRSAPFPFRSGELRFELTDRLVIDVHVRLGDADRADELATKIADQGQMITTLGLVESINAWAEGDALLLRLELSDRSLRQLVQLVGAGLGAGMLAPTVTPPPPTRPTRQPP